MNLAIDIGNTSIKKVTFLENSIGSTRKIRYSKGKLSEIKAFFSKDLQKYKNISICSVVPEVDEYLKKTFSNKKNFYFIQKRLLKSFVHSSVNLRQLGIDRIINVLSVNHLFPNKEDFIIIDLGTATTLDIVKKNKYFGGVILPGLTTSYANLVDLASGIKKIKLENSNKVFGKNTKDALLSGFNTGYKTMIDGYIKIIKRKFNSNFKVIFTGGYASNVLNNQNQYLYKEDLTLLGISLYHQMIKKMSNLDILNSKNQSFFLPIGGIGEIGGNNYLYSFKGEQIIVDAGISFADDSLPGVDITIPDPYIFLNPSIKPKAMILTHAHEDHVGGLEYYFDKIDFPIYCNQFTYAYIKHKFKRIPDFEKKFHIIKSYQEISFKNFSFQLIPTTHSIPDPTGIFFKTNDGNIYHTGDWKIDKNPVTGDPFDYDNFKILKEENIDLLIGDSTNAGVKEISRSESELDPSFDRLFEDLNGRIIVTCFSSNIARLKTVISNALKHKKKIFVVGRSIKRAITTAIEEKLIDNFEILNEKLFADYNRDNVVLICTGSQGEKNSALSKIANNTHNHIKLSPKDNIIFSSKEIPGNEKAISYLKNSFSYLGLNIISDEDDFVHVSGHPGIQEIKEFYQYVKPISLIPMHGEYLHLKKHLEIAHDLNIEKSLLLLSGDLCELDLKDKNHKLIDQFVIKKLPVIQNSIIEDMNFLSERGKILNNGIVSLNIILNKKLDILKSELHTKGFPFEFDKEFIQEQIKESLLNKILFMKDEMNERSLHDQLEDIAKKTFSKNFSLKPELLIHLSIV